MNLFCACFVSLLLLSFGLIYFVDFWLCKLICLGFLIRCLDMWVVGNTRVVCDFIVWWFGLCLLLGCCGCVTFSMSVGCTIVGI